jgi:long-chain acyl-CoA synthetase
MTELGKPITLQKLFWDSVSAHGSAMAQGWNADGAWHERTYAEFGEAVLAVARGLLGLGVSPGDRVALWSKNSPRWAEVDWANQTAGLATVPVYDTLTAEKAAYIINDSGAKVVFVQDAEVMALIETVRKQLKAVKHFVVLNGPAPKGAMDYDALVAGGVGQEDALKKAMKKVKPDDLASLVYTSGTTGDPKGVMLTQWNFASNAKVARALVEFGPGDVFLSFLPLSHVFERTGGHFAAYGGGAKVVFARSIDTLVDDMQAVKPTLMMSVPRLYEKIYARIQENVAKASALRRFIFHWAIDVGRAANVYRQRNEELPKGLAKKVARANRLVFRKLQARVGGRIRFFVSGGAALSREIEEFFWAAGIQILQGYGLTETSPVTNVNYPQALRFGSVGKVVPGTQIKIDTTTWTSAREGVTEGEICFKGHNVMQGYWKNDAATKEVFDKEGWFHTGDIGYIDEDGFLFITDRKKEIIVMSNGKNVAPQPIENALKLQPHIAQSCVIGDNRKYMSALVQPDWEALEAFALKNGIAPSDRGRLVADQRVVSLIEKEVEAVNKDLSRYEQIKKFWLVPVEWSLESGELTPTLKLKRRIIHERHKDAIEKLYPKE